MDRFRKRQWRSKLLSGLVLAWVSGMVTALLDDYNCPDSGSSQVKLVACCQSNDTVDESTIAVNYSLYGSATVGWSLSVSVTWDPVTSADILEFEYEYSFDVSSEDPGTLEPPGLIQYEVLWGQIEDVDFGGEQDLSHSGRCNGGPTPCITDWVRRGGVIVDEPRFNATDLQFNFGYRFQVRVLLDGDPVGLSVCLDGASVDRERFFTPDCYEATNDAEFCQNIPVAYASEPVNITIADTATVTTFSELRQTINLTWKMPLQVYGSVRGFSLLRRLLEREDEDSSIDNIHTRFLSVGANDMVDTVYEYTFPAVLNDTLYQYEIDTVVISSNENLTEYEVFGGTAYFTHRTYIEPIPVTTVSAPTTMLDGTPTVTVPPSNIWILVVMFILLAVVIALAILFVSRRLKDEKKDEEELVFRPRFQNRVETTIKNRMDYVEPDFRVTEILDYDNIKEGIRLGSGQFGEVFKGEAMLQGSSQWTVVAIKKPKNITEEIKDDFKNEIRLMLELGKHPNIVSVLGCCTVDEPYYLLTVFMEFGDLLHFLRKAVDEENWKLDPIYKVTVFNQLQIARQITDGMNYVSETRFFHGDLAARNILVGAHLNIRITDFGLTDDLYQKEYTRLQSGAKRPYKWYSPESIEHHFCTLKTDVWSFGVLLWEIVTFGQVTPYHGMSIQEVLYRLKNGYRMACPPKTPEFLDKLIQSCWQLKAQDRPSFHDLYETIGFLLERATADDANYIVAGDESDEEDEEETHKRKGSLVYTLNLLTLDPSDVCGSADSAYVGSGDRGAMSVPSEYFSGVTFPIAEEEETGDGESGQSSKTDGGAVDELIVENELNSDIGEGSPTKDVELEPCMHNAALDDKPAIEQGGLESGSFWKRYSEGEEGPKENRGSIQDAAL